mgnify:CR=1 FL=1
MFVPNVEANFYGKWEIFWLGPFVQSVFSFHIYVVVVELQVALIQNVEYESWYCKIRFNTGSKKEMCIVTGFKKYYTEKLKVDFVISNQKRLSYKISISGFYS